MLYIRIICLLLTYGLCGAQWMYPTSPLYQPRPVYHPPVYSHRAPHSTQEQQDSCSSTLDDLNLLLELAKILEDDEKESPNPPPHSGLSEEIILKLVNALIYTATQNCGPQRTDTGSYCPKCGGICRCGAVSGGNGGTGSQGGGTGTNGANGLGVGVGLDVDLGGVGSLVGNLLGNDGSRGASDRSNGLGVGLGLDVGLGSTESSGGNVIGGTGGSARGKSGQGYSRHDYQTGGRGGGDYSGVVDRNRANGLRLDVGLGGTDSLGGDSGLLRGGESGRRSGAQGGYTESGRRQGHELVSNAGYGREMENSVGTHHSRTESLSSTGSSRSTGYSGYSGYSGTTSTLVRERGGGEHSGFDGAGGVVGGVGDLVGGVGGALDGVVGGVDDLLGGVGGALDGVTDGVGNLVGGLGGTLDGVVGGVGDLLGGVGGALDGVVGGVGDLVGGVDGALDGVVGGVGDLVGGASPSHPSIQNGV